MLGEAPAITLSDPASPTTSASTPPVVTEAQTYTVRLVVFDGTGASASDDVRVTVVPASSEPPDAGPPAMGDDGGGPIDGSTDAGDPGDIGGGGCSCRATPGAPGPLGLALLAVLGLLLRRRR